MTHRRLTSRIFTAASAVAAAAAFVAGPTTAAAQQPAADLTVVPPVPTDYTPKKTEWGDYDFRGIWPIENIPSARILFQRPDAFGNRVYVTDAEFAKRVAAAEKSDQAYDPEGGLNSGGTQGLVDWLRTNPFGRRTSMLVSPADGQLPALTPEAEALYKAGRSGWVPGQHYDWVDDFDSWDRCISRGFPASMFPFRYNNGIRVWQAPGYVVIDLEMLGTRVIPLGDSPAWPGNVEAWMGNSRGHWEGKTLVIETDNIKSGDSATREHGKRAASPVNMATQNVPPFNTIPTSAQAKTVERLTMTGPDTIVYEITYEDPEVFTAPWTARLDWTRNQDYKFYEYACHEGNVQLRNYVSASRAHRADIAAGRVPAEEEDSRERFAQQFDFDPAAMP
ncbi:hypothetical protein [Altericroceibacterium xinjiangense]|uniref:hypothetical protein n=1 Tax=Altericroceibacterium xinjiangense TaxID=762261 RepID=UPI0019D00CC5|nr:hypothetical protein [Altericroceibacterium xinjiangense]